MPLQKIGDDEQQPAQQQASTTDQTQSENSAPTGGTPITAQAPKSPESADLKKEDEKKQDEGGSLKSTISNS